MIYLLLITLFLVGLYLSAHYNWWRPSVDALAPRVLMYHSVQEQPGDTPTELVVTPQRFAEQLDYLIGKGYQFCTVSELIAVSEAAHKRVALTFDDGFRDNYQVMFPILKAKGAKATIYLAPEMEQIEKLSADEIREMDASGLVEFGAHTMTHINVSQTSLEQAGTEILASKRWVEALLQKPCDAFAYPYGRFNDANVEQVKRAGFTSAVTVKKGIEPLIDFHRIKRVSVLRSTNRWQFAIALAKGRYRV